MIALISSLALFLLAPSAQAQVGPDLNCTTYNGTAFVYSNSATVCSNLISDAACAALYPPATAGTVVASGTAIPRPASCYTTTTATPASIILDMKTAAITNCPKTCGYCCQSDAYSCPNAQYPRINCATITNTQCQSAEWRTIIAADCPSACGFCNAGGCVDAVPNCAADPTICNAIGLQDFVNKNCQRSCGRCASTTASGTGFGTCTTYNADSSRTCATWKANGFCTNTFYTLAQRKASCATTCQIC